jgi:hypothetical protein
MSKKSICLSMILLLCAASQGLTCDVSPVVGAPKPVVGSNNKARPIRLIETGPRSFYSILEQRLVKLHQKALDVHATEGMKLLRELQLKTDDWVFYTKEYSHRLPERFAIYNAYTGDLISSSYEPMSFSDTNEVIPPIELDDQQSKAWREVKSTQPEECRVEVTLEDGDATSPKTRRIHFTTIQLPPPIDLIDKAHTGHFIATWCK